MKTITQRMCIVFVIALVAMTGWPATGPAETIQRTVRGTVIATDTTARPQTIVVKVILPNREVMIVGARVPTDTTITRGPRKVRLADVKAGETTDITYLKTSDGLIARSIRLR